MMLAPLASLLISTSTLSTPGSSLTAKDIAKRLSEGRKELLDSHFLGFGAKLAMNGLAAVAQECRTANWDGYGAEPVSQEAIDQAKRFLEALPLEMQPTSVGAEADGSVTLEWYRSIKRTLSISIASSARLHYAAVYDATGKSGFEDFFGRISEDIINLINRVEQPETLLAA
jgi:hypothetical protein